NKPIWPENPPQSAKIPPHDSQSVKKSDPQQATAPTQSEFQQPVSETLCCGIRTVSVPFAAQIIPLAVRLPTGRLEGNRTVDHVF
ncbi:hypothetical protein, partial [Rhizobium sp. NZLR5]|uniref:hypothetical protein n=1 Tax=Rhizobium sp. NZLR5 TaxID=2731103 RepID=UPI001C835EC3